MSSSRNSDPATPLAHVPVRSCQIAKTPSFKFGFVEAEIDWPAELGLGTTLRSPRLRKVMVKTDTQTVARLLREYAHRSSLGGGNPYRAKAYLKAADSLSALAQPLDRIIAAGMLTDIPGIGDAIADIVTELYQTGSHSSLEKLRQEVPEGLLELFALPGLRPDKILKLHEALGISSLAELEAAAKEDRV